VREDFPPITGNKPQDTQAKSRGGKTPGRGKKQLKSKVKKKNKCVAGAVLREKVRAPRIGEQHEKTTKKNGGGKEGSPREIP